MRYFHLKLGIGIIVVFGLLLLGFALWTPGRVKYYAWQYRSPDVAARVKAVDGLIRLGEPGTEKLKAIYPDGPEAAEMLIECWDDVTKRIKGKNKAFALLKLEKGWEVGFGLYSPLSYLHVAAFNGYLETVKLLMKKGDFIVCHGWLIIRKSKGNEKEKAGYKPKRIYGAPIHVAAASGRNHVINYMLSQGIDVDAKDDYGMTPLHQASWQGQTTTAGLLISKGADINATNDNNWTPLHLAAEYGYTKTAALLISKGADVNAKDDDGWTPLHFAAIIDHTKTAELLISKGADVNATDTFGMTPLHLAAINGCTKTSELLISKGAHVNAKDFLGRTVLDRAIYNQRKETEKLLRALGAKTGAELEAEKK